MPTPTLLQVQTAAAGQSAGNTFSLAFANASVAGSLLVAAVRNNHVAGGTLTSVTDSQGNTWTVVGPLTNSTDLYVAYALNTVGGSIPTVHFNYGAAVGGISPVMAEYSNVASFHFHDSGAIGTSATATSNTITPLVGDLVLGFLMSVAGSTTASTTAGGGFTIRESSTTGGATFCAFEDQVVSSANPITSNFGLSASQAWASFVFSFGIQVFSISGNAGNVAGATISYTGASSGSVTADGSGNYTIPSLLPGSYTITPSSSAGFGFSPTSQNETITNANITGVNFTSIPPVGATSFSPFAGTYSAPVSVTLTNANSSLSGFAMFYTLDGSTPTTNSTPYVGPIAIGSNTTLKVTAFASGHNPTTSTAVYKFKFNTTVFGTQDFTNQPNTNPVGGQFTTITGLSALQVIGGALAAGSVAACGAYLNTLGSSPLAQYTEITLAAAPTSTSTIGLRVQQQTGANTCYEASISNSAVVLQSISAGTGTSLGSSIAHTTLPGDVIRFGLQGNILSGVQLNLVINGVVVWSLPISTGIITGGVPGIRITETAAVNSLVAGITMGVEGDSRYVQSFTFGSDGGSTQYSGAYNSPVTAGNLLVCIVQTSANNGNIQVSDNINGFWTKSPGNFLIAFYEQAIFYVLNTKAGTPTVTLTINQAAHGPCVAAEYALQNAIFDTSAVANASDGTPTLAFNTSLPNDLIVLNGHSNGNLAIAPEVLDRNANLAEVKLYDTRVVTSGSAILAGIDTSPTTGLKLPTDPWILVGASFSPPAPASNVFSVTDSRTPTSTTPNLSRSVQATLIYDVPKVDSRAQGAPVDSRAAGAPVDSRVAPNIPLNSRTPGVNGPGN